MASIGGAGWSSPVARQAHNLKVVGSNPTPATKMTNKVKALQASLLPVGLFLCLIISIYKHTDARWIALSWHR